ncbi:g865 [Coccomyxa elongata]
MLAEQAVLAACEVLRAGGRLLIPAATVNREDLLRAWRMSHHQLQAIQEGTKEARARDILRLHLGFQPMRLHGTAALVQGR